MSSDGRRLTLHQGEARQHPHAVLHRHVVVERGADAQHRGHGRDGHHEVADAQLTASGGPRRPDEREQRDESRTDQVQGRVAAHADQPCRPRRGPEPDPRLRDPGEQPVAQAEHPHLGGGDAPQTEVDEVGGLPQVAQAHAPGLDDPQDRASPPGPHHQRHHQGQRREPGLQRRAAPRPRHRSDTPARLRSSRRHRLPVSRTTGTARPPRPWPPGGQDRAGAPACRRRARPPWPAAGPLRRCVS